MGMIFHSLSEPESGAYLLQDVIDIEGDLDEELFRRCWQTIYQRHPILRSFFLRIDSDNPLQVVLRKQILDSTLIRSKKKEV